MGSKSSSWGSPWSKESRTWECPFSKVLVVMLSGQSDVLYYVTRWTECQNSQFRIFGCYECTFSIYFSFFASHLYWSYSVVKALGALHSWCCKFFNFEISFFLALFSIASKDRNDCWLWAVILPVWTPLLNDLHVSVLELLMSTFETSAKFLVCCKIVSL